MSGRERPGATIHVMQRRLKPTDYAKACGVLKETVYSWIHNNQLPEGATAYKTPTGRFIIHVDSDVHPAMPLYTGTA